MLNSLRIQNFKSWQDTGTIQFGAITGFFGTNSSGKTSILQFLLMLKQTVESSDRGRILSLGDRNSYVELGTIHDIIYNHDYSKKLNFEFEWSEINDSYTENDPIIIYNSPKIFDASIEFTLEKPVLDYFRYTIYNGKIQASRNASDTNDVVYDLFISSKNDDQKSELGFFRNPIRFYGFPNSAYTNFPQITDFLQSVEESLFELFEGIHYLGPLREHPQRFYTWSGESVQGVGDRGEEIVAALLASNQEGPSIFISNDLPLRSLEEHVAYWLRELGLIDSFTVRPIAPNRREYEIRVRKTAQSPEVFLTDVGFGVSQLLPVLVLLFYVPEGSTIILEQPEIHLHPAVQAGLADVFIDAIKRRNVQIILESHSEHLLQRLQRRLAEEALPTEQVKLYFTDFVGEASTLTPLDLDEYGNIRNWPTNFFGDSFADASAMMDAEVKRRQAKGEI